MESINLTKKSLTIFLLVDVACAGFGMGVPLLCIALGVLVGWRVARRLELPVVPQAFRRILLMSAGTSVFTLLMMLVIWGPCLAKLSEPDSALASFGMAMLLFGPRASFIAWLALMIIICPFLQFLMTLLGSCVTLAWLPNQTRAHA